MRRPLYVTLLAVSAAAAVAAFLLGWLAGGLGAVATGCWFAAVAGSKAHPRNWTQADNDNQEDR